MRPGGTRPRRRPQAPEAERGCKRCLVGQQQGRNPHRQGKGGAERGPSSSPGPTAQPSKQQGLAARTRETARAGAGKQKGMQRDEPPTAADAVVKKLYSSATLAASSTAASSGGAGSSSPPSGSASAMSVSVGCGGRHRVPSRRPSGTALASAPQLAPGAGRARGATNRHRESTPRAAKIPRGRHAGAQAAGSRRLSGEE